MKFRKTHHIWLCMFVLVGVFVLGSTSALAIEGICTPGQKALGTCLEIKNNLGQVVYIVKAVRLDEKGDAFDDVNPGENWPTQVGGLGAYSYWGGPADASYGPFVKPSAWSYIVFDLPSAPVDADPPGAQLPLDSFICGDATIDASRIAYKLNPSVNFKGSAIFTLYFDGDAATYDPCSGTKAYVLFGKDCSGGLLSPEDPYVQQRRFWCNDKVYVEVQYEKCTGIPYDQIKYYNLNVSPSPRDIGYEKDGAGNSIPPWVYATVPQTPDVPAGDRNFQVDNWGPAYGTLLCTDSDPVFVWKDRAYFCEP